MSRRQILKDETTNDPLGRGYAGMSDQQVADDLNLGLTEGTTAYRLVNQPVNIDELNLAVRESLKWTQYRERADLQTVAGTYDNPYMREFMDLFLTVSTATPIDMQSGYMTQVINGMEGEGSMGPVAAQELRDYGEREIDRGTEIGASNPSAAEIGEVRA